MDLQSRLTNVPQMFSEGIEQHVAAAPRQRGAGRLLMAPISGVSAFLAATIARQAAPGVPRPLLAQS